MNEPSPRYAQALKATRDFHATKDLFTGRFLLNYRHYVEMVLAEHDVLTVLDYGCGKGRQWSEPMADGRMLADRWKVKQVLHDPGVPQFSKEPKGTFDLVICTQVLCYVPTKDVRWIMDRLCGFADKAVFVGERIGPVKKKIHNDYLDEMPRNLDHEEWKSLLLTADLSKPVYLGTRGSRHNAYQSKFERIA